MSQIRLWNSSTCVGQQKHPGAWMRGRGSIRKPWSAESQVINALVQHSIEQNAAPPQAEVFRVAAKAPFKLGMTGASMPTPGSPHQRRHTTHPKCLCTHNSMPFVKDNTAARPREDSMPAH